MLNGMLSAAATQLGKNGPGHHVAETTMAAEAPRKSSCELNCPDVVIGLSFWSRG